MSSPGQSHLTIYAKQLGPWTPDIDPRRNDKAAIIAIQNVIDDIDGPRSAFASQFFDYNHWDEEIRGKVTELKLANGSSLYGMQNGVWAIDPVSGNPYPLLLVNVTNKFWPWTIAQVGGFYYLAQYDIGLWQYDPVNNTIAHVDTPSGDIIRFIAAAFGRLVGFSDINIFVSALDDGTDLTPSLRTAAQAQSLSMVGGTAYRIEVVDTGFFVYLSAGILKATYTLQSFVYSYAPLTPAVQLFNPNASVFIPRVGAISLDQSGFNLSKQGEIPLPWEVLMGDYVKKNIIAYMDKSLHGTIGMYYSLSMQMLFVSFSANTNPGLMISTLCWSPITGKWSSFDHQHTGIFEVYDNVTNTYICSYMGVDGYMHSFVDTNFSEDLPSSPFTLLDYVYSVIDDEKIIATIDATDTEYELGTTEIRGSDNNPFFYDNITDSFGVFEINSVVMSDTENDDEDDPEMNVSTSPIVGGSYINMDISGGVELYAIPYQMPRIGLNSSLTVGPLRYTTQTFADETSIIDTLLLGLTPTTSFVIYEDWNTLQAPSEDWDLLSGAEDWGQGVQTPNNFSLTLRSTNDGINPGQQGDEQLPVFEDLGSSQIFKPQGWEGIYHQATLAANDPGQAFALKTIDITGAITGRLAAG